MKMERKKMMARKMGVGRRITMKRNMSRKMPVNSVCSASPVFDEGRGADDDGFFDGGFAIGTLFEQRPDERYALQRLAQTHLVRHDAAWRRIGRWRNVAVINESIREFETPQSQ